MADPAPASRAASPARIVFIDLARALAVLMMIQGHTIDTLLVPEARAGVAYEAWLFLRGLTSVSFLTLSGIAVSVTAMRHWDDHRRVSARWFRRVRRFVFFLALGYLMRFPMGKFVHLVFASPERWQSFFVVDILQLVAATLLLVQALVWLSVTPSRFMVVTAALGALVVGTAPVVWTVDWTRYMPLWAASYMSPAWGSLFPMFPWAGYILIGGAFGAWLERWLHHDTIRHVAKLLAWSGAIAIAVVGIARLVGLAPYGPIDQRVSPGFFVLRLGCVLLLLGGLAWASAGWRRLPVVIRALAEESLLVYAVHIALLYGSLWGPGLRTLVGPVPGEFVLAWIVVMIGAMTALAWGWNRLQHEHPRLAVACRVATMTALIYPLLGV
ncbi:MAG: heparan-alpha-glucosaminide N-acetyltransferase domain-containing protein [Vicinamibacterales bacterium]